MVEEEHPLKQGLKLFPVRLIKTTFRVEEEHPLKQRLKLDNIFTLRSFNFVEEEHPLKQGFGQLNKITKKIS